jgi:hypothetical protein
MKYSLLERRARIAAWGFLSVLALVLVFAGLAWAQTQVTGDIVGVVADPSGAVVPNAKLTLMDNSKGVTQDVMANKDGGYRFSLLSPGSYTVTATASGFSSKNRTVDVNLGQITTVDFQLSVGATNQTVTVTEAAPVLQTENGNVATTMNQQQVMEVPNPGNDLTYIAQTAPAVVMNTQAGYGNFSSNGMSGTSNLFTLDGMDYNDPFLNLNNSGATNLTLGQSEVQEASVVSNGYSAEYGGLPGANVNYITKSGGNTWHGKADYFWNGRVMNANDWLNNESSTPRAFDNVNQWAGSAGGPIVKDKAFFWFDTEGIRIIIPSSVLVDVPSPDFEYATVQNLTNLGLTASIPYYCQGLTLTSKLGPPITCPAPPTSGPNVGVGNFNLFNAAPGIARAVPGGGPGDTKNGCGVNVIAGFGPGALPCADWFRTNTSNLTDEMMESGRFDFNIGPNDRMFVRMQHDNGFQATYSDAINKVFNFGSNQPEYQGQLEETHAFSPTMTNQFILSGQWYTAYFGFANTQAAYNLIPQSLAFGDGTFYSLAYAGGFNAGDSAPSGRNVTQYQVTDDVSKMWGNHTVKFGTKFRRNDITDRDFPGYVTGLVVPLNAVDYYDGGVAPASNPNDAGSFISQNFTNKIEHPMGVYELAGYVEDSWRARSNLTLTIGLRAEHPSNLVCQDLCFNTLAQPFLTAPHNPDDPYNQALNPAGVLDGINVGTTTGNKQLVRGLTNIQWEPRFGFAWQPLGTQHNLVVRGGIGIFYDVFPGYIADSMVTNAPGINPFTIYSSPNTGYFSPAQPGNALATAVAANAAFNTAFATGVNSGVTVVPSLTDVQGFNHAPQYQKWSLELQKGFGVNTSLTITYAGNHGIHEVIEDRSINAFEPSSGFGAGLLPTAQPDTRFGGVALVNDEGVSNWNGLTATFQHRVAGSWGGGTVLLAYTYSHGLDEISNGGLLPFQYNYGYVSPQTPQIPLDYRNMYGSSDYDVRHSLVGNYVWELPIRKALMGHGWAPLVDGWQVAGTVFARTGLPFTVMDGNEAGALGSNLDFGPVFPNPIAGVPVYTKSNCREAAGTGIPCLNLSAFPASATETTFGVNGLRNAFQASGFFSTDFSVMKKTKIPHWERGELALGVQMFNAFNHPNFGPPVSNISSGLFGTVVNMVAPPTSILASFLGGDSSPRMIQLKAQFTF